MQHQGAMLQPRGVHDAPEEDEDDNYQQRGRAAAADYDSGDSDVDRMAYGCNQALPVDNAAPDYASGPPTSAEEYLRRVRHEARQLPRVVASGINPRVYDELRTRVRMPEAVTTGLPEPPNFARPKDEWVREFLDDFDDLRDELQCDDEDGAPHHHPTTRTLEGLLAHTDMCGATGPGGSTPTAAFLRSLDRVTTTRYLRQRINNVRSAGMLREEDALWLFGLLARLERPVDADICASLQALHRQLVRLRARVSGVGSRELPWINMLIVITGACFGQDEELAQLYGD